MHPQLRHSVAFNNLIQMGAKIRLLATALLTLAALPAALLAQGAPAAPNAVWQPKGTQSLGHDYAVKPREQINIDSSKTYALAELIDLAEQHNPETRFAWAQAKSRAAELGIARSALYPTLSAVAIAISLRQAALI